MNLVQVPISAVMITKNSERMLANVLESLRFCEEVVIVDSGSVDRTLDIAKRYNAKVFIREFDGYSAQKQFSVDQAKHDWVFVVDSDEVVTPELQAEMTDLFDGRPPEAGYEIPRKLVFLGKTMNFSGTLSKPLRLFHRQKGAFNGALVHEEVVLNEPNKGTLSEAMLHYSYPSIEDYFEKFNRYTSHAALEMRKKGQSASLSAMVLAFPVHFVKRYVFRLGFLDGYHGFLWSLFSAFYPVVKLAKLIEIQKRQ